MATNYTPETATTVSSLPYAVLVPAEEIDAAPEQTGYEPSCQTASAVDQLHALWWKLVPPAGVKAVRISIAISPNGPYNYYPIFSVWRGTPGSLTEMLGVCCSVLPGATVIGVVPGESYYIQVNDDDNTNAAVDTGLQLDIVAAPTLAVPAGSLFIANDVYPFPAAILDQATGEVLRILDFPAFEQADVLPNGKMLVAAETEDDNFQVRAYQLYSRNLRLLASNTSAVIANGDPVAPVTSNRSDRFYVLVRRDSSPFVEGQKVITFDDQGVQGDREWTLPTSTLDVTGMAVSRDETKLYYVRASSADQAAIHVHDLVNDAALPDLVGPISNTWAGGRDVLLMDDDTLLRVVVITGGGGTKVHRYDQSGTLLNTYDIPTTHGSVARISRSINPLAFWVMSFPTAFSGSDPGTTRLQHLALADGAELDAFVVDQRQANNFRTSPTWGPAQSCPLLVLAGFQCECCMAIKLDTINRALAHLGISKKLTQDDLDADDIVDAQQANLHVDTSRREALKQFPWAFATKYADSADAEASGDPMELVDGDGETPVNGDWLYAYRLPTDCIQARRILPAGAAGTGRQFNANPVPFRKGRTVADEECDEYGLIYTNLPDAVLEYTRDVCCVDEISDPLFLNVWSLKLAAKMAPTLSRNGKTEAQLEQLAALMLNTGAAVDAREQQQEKDGNASWIDAR